VLNFSAADKVSRAHHRLTGLNTGGDQQLGLDQHFYSGIFVAGVERIKMS
jgi:hypothetical protein